MAQYALGKAWDRATSAEREEFLAAFEGAIVTAYLRRMRDYRGATMSFVVTAAERRRPHGCKPFEPARCRGNLDLEIAALWPVLADR